MLALALAVSLAIPLPAESQKWARARTPGFTIVSSASENKTRQVGVNLERLASALRYVNPRFSAATVETKIFLFGRRRESQPYFDLLLTGPRRNWSGVYAAHGGGTGTMVIDAEQLFISDRTAVHELMHGILSGSDAPLPLWLEEGIAEYFSTAQVRGGVLTVGAPIPEHRQKMRAGTMLPLPEVFAASSGSSTASHEQFYPVSWGIVDSLIRADRKAFYDFVADLEKGVTAEAALRSRYDMTPIILDQIVRNPFFKPNTTSVLNVDRVDVEVTLTPMSHADAVGELGRFIGVIGTAREDAERFLTTYPDHARSIASRALLRSWEGDFVSAGALADKALALAPDDAAVLLDAAMVLLQNALGPYTRVATLPPDAEPRYRRARELARRARNYDPPLADAIIGTSYLVEEDARPGIAPLEHARAARPGRLDFALNLYAILLRAGETERARALSERVIARARDAQAAAAARTAYARESVQRVQKLLGEDRLSEGVAVLRDAVAVSADPDLARQLKDLEVVEATRRQIALYNQAVDATNERRHKQALEILDGLIASGTDEKIVSQARHLREVVKRRIRH